jgi:hypothetical protein
MTCNVRLAALLHVYLSLAAVTDEGVSWYVSLGQHQVRTYFKFLRSATVKDALQRQQQQQQQQQQH